jgi:hypothetical protein
MSCRIITLVISLALPDVPSSDSLHFDLLSQYCIVGIQVNVSSDCIQIRTSDRATCKRHEPQESNPSLRGWLAQSERENVGPTRDRLTPSFSSETRAKFDSKWDLAAALRRDLLPQVGYTCHFPCRFDLVLDGCMSNHFEISALGFESANLGSRLQLRASLPLSA